jgi:hypothetical protein
MEEECDDKDTDSADWKIDIEAPTPGKVLVGSKGSTYQRTNDRRDSKDRSK